MGMNFRTHIELQRISGGKLLIAAFAATTLCWTLQAQAQADFPNRPVRMVNPYTPGGSVDLVGRAVAAGLSEIWGRQVIVDNRPGAGTQIGTEIVVRADPDGYTMLCTSSTIAILSSMYKNMRFDPAKDLSAVSLVAISPFLLVVTSSLPAKSVQDLIALAKSQPGQVTGASSGVGTTNHLTLEMFKAATRIDVLHVPYKGGGPAISDLIGGQVKMHFNTPGTLLPHVKAGRLRALALTSAQRADFAPDVPTVAESGVPGFESTVWYGIYGPKALPPRLVQRWSDAINQYMKTPQAQEHWRRSYMIAGSGTPAQFKDFHNRETERWSAVIKASGVEPQ
ncbi:MAG TPA: tripartite tricarboxylate transporter substrate binding protein [Burkholderiales bacterium]|nr:tripartite tricarboxylate transporter substrate binding protein [Burkholderiales bacterium]